LWTLFLTRPRKSICPGSEMPLLTDILIRPARGAARLRDNPRWLSALLILASLSVLVEIFTQSYSSSLMLASLPPSAEDKARILDEIRGGMALRAAFLPVRLVSGWLTFSLLILLVSRSLLETGRVRFLQVFSLEVHSEAVLLLGKVAALVNLLVYPASGHRLLVPFSAACFAGAGDYSIFSFLNAMNVFTLWYALLLSVGISAISGAPWWRGAVIGFSTCALWITLNVCLIRLVQENLHMVP